MDILNIYNVVTLLVGILIGGFLKSYLKKKGENFATKEDFEEILNQVKKTTEVTEEIKNELSFAKSTYDQYLHEILDYYAGIYEYYQLCQMVSGDYVYNRDDGTKIDSKDYFLKRYDDIVKNVKTHEGYLRLLMTPEILQQNEEIYEEFNNFRKIIIEEDTDEKKKCFNKIHEKKDKLENKLRNFLRLEKIIK